jgi:2,3-diketo-5-methylthio-1-phosphopentane phosphatase
MRNALVSDFDGTITENDFFALVADRYMRSDAPDFFALYRAGKMTHVEAMQAFFRFTPSDPDVLQQLLRNTQPDEGLARTVSCLNDAGWDLIVVSAGSSWYIEKIFEALEVRTAQVHSNAGNIVPGQGLQIDTTKDVDKPAVVRDALARYDKVAFAGDGPPDVAPSLLVKPELRFARRYLAEELTRRGESFHPFARWRDVVESLTAS